MLAIGLMSGTSLDGVDTVLCEISGSLDQLDLKQLDFMTYPIEKDVKDRIRKVIHGKNISTQLICSLNFELGQVFSCAVKTMLDKHGLKGEDVRFVANHGQTLYHLPKASHPYVPSTLQMGEAAIIAYDNHIDVIDDFRVMDMAAKGEGAPLVPFSEMLLYRKANEVVALQNIGGISNVTILGNEHVQAFDCGPGNMMIDEAMRHFFDLPYDANGACAASAPIDENLFNELIQHPYLDRKPPKSTGREDFGEAYVLDIIQRYPFLSAEQIISTFTSFTAYCIADSIQRFSHTMPTSLIVGGGGAYNAELMRRIQSLLPNVDVKTQEAYGYSSEAKEAIAFVILGYAFLNRVPANVPSATGAKDLVILGKLTPNPFKNALYL